MRRRTPTPTPPASTPTPSTISKKPSPNVGEVAGGTAANIFVVCCCCPCGMAECLITAAYKFPASIVRRLWRRRRQKVTAAEKRSSKKRGLHEQGNNNSAENSGGPTTSGARGEEVGDVDMRREFEKMKKETDDESAEAELDRKMWDQFHNTGFWRTCSQRQINTTNISPPYE